MGKYHTAEWQRNYLEKKRLESGLELIACLDCGKKFRQVGSHVVQVHGYEKARDYREAHGLDVKKGILPKDLKELFAEQALENRTVENLKNGKKFWFKKGDSSAGKYHRSDETMARLRAGLPKRKINHQQAMEISQVALESKAKGIKLPVEELAKKYNVCNATIYNVLNNKYRRQDGKSESD